MERIEKILVVDDDPDIGLMLKMMLNYRGYKVTLLERADRVEETIRENNIEFIFMDMLLSGVNGTDICVRIKSDATISHIPLVMMSAHPDAEKVCFESGANDFISKPFDIQEILSKINNHVK